MMQSQSTSPLQKDNVKKRRRRNAATVTSEDTFLKIAGSDVATAADYTLQRTVTENVNSATNRDTSQRIAASNAVAATTWDTSRKSAAPATSNATSAMNWDISKRTAEKPRQPEKEEFHLSTTQNRSWVTSNK